MDARVALTETVMANQPESDEAEFSDPESMRALRDTAERQQDEQRERRRTLDLKLVATFPVNAAVFALLSTSLPASGVIPWYLWALTACAVLAFAAYLGYAVRAYTIREWSERPDLETLREIAEEHPATVVDAWIASEISKSIHKNEPELDRKALCTGRALLATLAVVTFVVLLVIVARVA